MLAISVPVVKRLVEARRAQFLASQPGVELMGNTLFFNKNPANLASRPGGEGKER
jgi:hypothetical protein